jgi:hypothetical protein
MRSQAKDSRIQSLQELPWRNIVSVVVYPRVLRTTRIVLAHRLHPRSALQSDTFLPSYDFWDITIFPRSTKSRLR